MDVSTHLLLVLLATTVGGGLGVNLVAQIIKKLFGLQSDGVIHTMVVAVSIAASAAQYVMGLKAQLPPEILGVTATSIYGFSQGVFKYAKLTDNFLEEVRAFNDSQKTAAAKTSAADAAVAAVQPPAEIAAEVPVAQTTASAPVTQPDF